MLHLTVDSKITILVVLGALFTAMRIIDAVLSVAEATRHNHEPDEGFVSNCPGCQEELNRR